MKKTPPHRLTYLITGLQYGGANIGMARLLSELSPTEFDITVASVARTDPDVVPLLPDHVDLVQCDLDSKLAFHRLRPLIGVLRETDVLVCSLFHATMAGTVLGSLLRVPTIMIWHHNTAHPNSSRPAGYRIVNRLADRVLADSEAVERELVERYGMDRDDISQLPIAGVDTTKFSPEAGRHEGGQDVTRVATVGRLTEQKGYPDLLTCARRLGEDFDFHVAGAGPELETLEANAPANVTFHGKIPDDEMAEFYASADVYFQPSRWEGLCMTVIEAMACGLPVVASAVGGIEESTVEGETAFCCKPGDVDCFIERIEQLGTDADLRATMGRAGRDRVKEHYSANALATAFREALAACSNRQV